MPGHHNVSVLFQNLGNGESRPQRVSLRNDPPVPDFGGREDVPDWAVPDRSDKEVYKVSLKAAGTPNADTAQGPTVAMSDQLDDLGGIDNPGNANNTVGNSGFEPRGFIEWWPHIDPATEWDTDRAVFNFVEDPIPWQDGDLLHLLAQWHPDAGYHDGFTVHARVFWRHR